MMNRKFQNRIGGLALFILISTNLFAQPGFSWQAKLKKVDQDGFYKIGLTNEIAGKTTSTMSDLRVLDETGNQVPFLFTTEKVLTSPSVTIDFPIAAHGVGDDQLYYYHLSNSTRLAIDHLSLSFQNTETNRLLSISGSDDEKQWYAISENVPVHSTKGNSQTSFVQDVAFPLSDYAFFKITLQGKGITPIKLVKAGISEGGRFDGQWMALPTPVISKHDSTDQHSYFRFQFDAEYPVDKLVLQFGGAPFFQRELSVYSNDKFSLPIVEATATSSMPLEIAVAQKTNQLWVVMDNKDNPPLQLVAVKAYMHRKDIVAYLKGGKSYKLVFGDPSLNKSPSYDIGYFRDSIPADLQVVGIEEVQSGKNAEIVKLKTGVIGSWFTWIAIGFVLMILLVTTAKLTRDVNKSRGGGQ